MVTLWIVGRRFRDSDKQWEVMGVFDAREKAVAACRRDLDWVGPIKLNECLSDESIRWPGGFYPVCEANTSRTKET